MLPLRYAVSVISEHHGYVLSFLAWLRPFRLPEDLFEAYCSTSIEARPVLGPPEQADTLRNEPIPNTVIVLDKASRPVHFTIPEESVRSCVEFILATGAR